MIYVILLWGGVVSPKHSIRLLLLWPLLARQQSIVTPPVKKFAQSCSTCVREDDTRWNKSLALSNDTNLEEVSKPFVTSQTKCVDVIKQIEKKYVLSHMNTQFNSYQRKPHSTHFWNLIYIIVVRRPTFISFTSPAGRHASLKSPSEAPPHSHATCDKVHRGAPETDTCSIY